MAAQAFANGKKKLGQLLVSHGWAEGSDVMRAVQSQRRLGGRIGTRLLELEAVSEEHLLEALAEQVGVPAANIEILRHIPDSVLEMVSPKVAERCQVIPFAINDREIDVATPATGDLASLDEVAHCTRRRVRAHVSTEVRFYEALGRYYGVECPRRYTTLIDRLNRARYLWEESAKIKVQQNGQVEITWQDLDQTFSTNVIQSAAANSLAQPSAQKSTIFTEFEPELLFDDGPDAAMPGEILTLGAVDELLGEQEDADGIGQVLLRFAAQHFSRTAIFKARRDGMKGWLAHGVGIQDEPFKAIDIHFREPSVFLNLQRGAELHLGPLAPMPMHRQIADAWGEWPKDCLMVPIRLKERLVAVLYGDCSPASVSGLKIDDFRHLSVSAAMAFELCILRRKMAQS